MVYCTKCKASALDDRRGAIHMPFVCGGKLLPLGPDRDKWVAFDSHFNAPKEAVLLITSAMRDVLEA